MLLEDYFRQYGLLTILGAVALIVPSSMLILGWLLTRLGVRPLRPSPVKLETYECGMATIGGRWSGFNIRYYSFALLFVVFDIEVIVLFPWALYLNQLPLFGLVAGLTFVAILVLGYIYEWRKGGLEWT